MIGLEHMHKNIGILNMQHEPRGGGCDDSTSEPQSGEVAVLRKNQCVNCHGVSRGK